MDTNNTTRKFFSLKVLGRTIEHLGSQMYKHRGPSIAELIANAWDAGSTNVEVNVPEGEIDTENGKIIVTDTGCGMSPDDVQNKYLVIGRNRRAIDGALVNGRKIMGRKGLGKLAGFGLCDIVTVITWTNMTEAVKFQMELSKLKLSSGVVDEIEFPWTIITPPVNSESGTRIELSRLRHHSPIDVESLRETIARRFSRIARGEMTIKINGTLLSNPDLKIALSYPEDGDYATETLPSGNIVQYRYQFASDTIKSKEMQGFVVYANERAAQAPPFFFGVETTASGQHSTRYVTGEVIADFVDSGIADEDNVSTDRQELDWERDDLKELNVPFHF